MKRSEIIKIMLLELNKNSLDNARERRSAMEHVLYEIEKAGMLPPISDSTKYEMTGYGSIYYDIPVWEPEENDSKKAREELVKQAQEFKMYDIHGTRQITISAEDFDKLVEDLESEDEQK